MRVLGRVGQKLRLSTARVGDPDRPGQRRSRSARGGNAGPDGGTTVNGSSRTAVLEVAGVQWASSKAVAEAVLGRRPGVLAVDANPVSQTATVTYDPSRTSVAELSAVDPGLRLPLRRPVGPRSRVRPARGAGRAGGVEHTSGTHRTRAAGRTEEPTAPEASRNPSDGSAAARTKMSTSVPPVTKRQPSSARDEVDPRGGTRHEPRGTMAHGGTEDTRGRRAGAHGGMSMATWSATCATGSSSRRCCRCRCCCGRRSAGRCSASPCRRRSGCATTCSR